MILLVSSGRCRAGPVGRDVDEMFMTF